MTAEKRYGTGVALVDLNGDDLLDLVVANGNDMAAEPISVHLHTGDATAPYDAEPSGDSPQEVAYHGDVCVGDIDDDGDIDVGVVYPFDNDLDLSRGGVRFFTNENGKLVFAGAWSVTGFAPFACDLGDVDRDGRLDLGVAVLWDRGGKWEIPKTPLKIILAKDRAALRIYRNRGTKFETTPWKSTSRQGFVALSFEDIDRDGALDLATAGRRVEVRFGTGKQVRDAPGVQSKERFIFPYGLHVADTGAARDLVVANSGCLSVPCFGRYVAWHADNGEARRRATWKSAPLRYPAPLTVADILDEPGLELIGGSWGKKQKGGHLLVYPADGSVFTKEPCLRSVPLPVSQYKAVNSIRPGQIEVRKTAAKSGGAGRVVRLESLPLRIVSVTVDGKKHDDWAWSPEHAWVSVGALRKGQQIEVEWALREARDLAVADWLPNDGDLVFLHDDEFKCDPNLQKAETAEVAEIDSLIPDEGDWRKVAKQLAEQLEIDDAGPTRTRFKSVEGRQPP